MSHAASSNFKFHMHACTHTCIYDTHSPPCQAWSAPLRLERLGAGAGFASSASGLCADRDFSGGDASGRSLKGALSRLGGAPMWLRRGGERWGEHMEAS